MIQKYGITMYALNNSKANEALLEDIQKLGVGEVGWDFELLFDCDDSLEPKIIEIVEKHQRTLTFYSRKEV